MAAKSTVSSSGSVDFSENVRRLLRLKLMVGIPASEGERKPDPGEKTAPNSATIGYVQEFGDDEKHIPARPFLVPGIRSIQTEIVEQLRQAGENAFDRDFSKVKARFDRAGIVAADAVRSKITDGPFAPLSQRTIEARAARGRKGAKQYLKLQAQGTPDWALQSADLVKPLIDTGQLRRSVTYIIKDGND